MNRGKKLCLGHSDVEAHHFCFCFHMFKKFASLPCFHCHRNKKCLMPPTKFEI